MGGASETYLRLQSLHLGQPVLSSQVLLSHLCQFHLLGYQLILMSDRVQHGLDLGEKTEAELRPATGCPPLTAPLSLEYKL